MQLMTGKSQKFDNKKELIMFRVNDLIMAVFSVFLLLAVNQYIPLANLINLLFNCLLIVIAVIYFMQFLNLIKPILPTPKIFK